MLDRWSFNTGMDVVDFVCTFNNFRHQFICIYRSFYLLIVVNIRFLLCARYVPYKLTSQ